jgi:hypothetical protein
MDNIFGVIGVLPIYYILYLYLFVSIYGKRIFSYKLVPF